jgi:hypothetical protein
VYWELLHIPSQIVVRITIWFIHQTYSLTLHHTRNYPTLGKIQTGHLRWHPGTLTILTSLNLRSTGPWAYYLGLFIAGFLTRSQVCLFNLASAFSPLAILHFLPACCHTSQLGNFFSFFTYMVYGQIRKGKGIIYLICPHFLWKDWSIDVLLKR